MASTPTWKLEAALGSGPSSLSGSTAWTDLSSYLDLDAGFTWSRGRQRELDAVQPGRLSVTLDNSTGYFTPGRGGSGLTLNTPLRLSATWAGVSYPVAFGFADSVPVVWEGGVCSRVTVTATDFTKLLARRILRSTYRETVLADGPVGYWPLDDPQTATSLANASTNPTAPNGLLVASKHGPGTVTLAAAQSPLAGDPGANAPTFATGAAGAFTYAEFSGAHVGYPNLIDLSKPWSAELWGNVTQPIGATTQVLAAIGGGSNAVVLVVQSGTVQVQAGGVVNLGAPPAGWFHVLLSSNGSGVTAYLNGTSIGATGLAPGASIVPWVRLGGGVGAPAGTLAVGDLFGANASLAHFALYGTALTSSQAATHYAFGALGTLPAPTNSVTGRVAALTRWIGVGTTNLDASDTTAVAAQATAGTDAATALAALTATEHGIGYFDATGSLRLRARVGLINQKTAFTVDVQAHGVDATTAFVVDDQLLFNDHTVSRPGGSAQRSVDTASVAAFGTYSSSESLLLTTDGEAADAADYRVLTHAHPKPRGDQVKLDPLTAPALWPSVLAADLGQMFTITGLPAEAPAGSMNLLIQQVSGAVTTQAASITFDTSTPDPTPYLVLDDPTFGQLDNNALFF